jgi:AAA domain
MSIVVSSTAQISQRGIKALVYGRAGVGKTRLAQTAPRPLILSAEAGLLSLRKADIPAIEVTSVDHLKEIYQWLTESKDASAYDTIYIDSLSEMAEVLLSNAKAGINDPRQAYGALQEQMTILVRAFRDLPNKHVVMVAKIESKVDEVTKVSTYMPAMPGTKLSQQLPYLFDEVFRLAIGYTADKTEYRYLQTRADFQHEAKDRSGALEAIEQPDLTLIFNKILNGA